MENKVKDKSTFVKLLVCSIIYLVLATTGIVFSFIYISTLGLFQPLIVFAAVVILIVLATLTTIEYNKVYKD